MSSSKSLGRSSGRRAQRSTIQPSSSKRATLQPETIDSSVQQVLTESKKAAASKAKDTTPAERQSLSPKIETARGADGVSWPEIAQSQMDKAINGASIDALRRCVRVLASSTTVPSDLIVLMLENPGPRAAEPTRALAPSASTTSLKSPTSSRARDGTSDEEARAKRAALLKRSSSFISRSPLSRQANSEPQIGVVSTARPTAARPSLPTPNNRLLVGTIYFKHGSKWKKRYIIADSDNLFVLKREPKLLTDIELIEMKISLFCASARRGEKKHSDTFTILTPGDNHAFRCSNSNEAQEYVTSLAAICQNLVHQSIGSKKTDYVGAGRARAESVAETEELKRVREVQSAHGGNDICADCSQLSPSWVSINLGIFVCDECSGGHRSLGSHISQVRSVQYDDLDDDQLKLLREMGNSKANEYFEFALPKDTIKPTPNTAIELKQAFVRAKYAKQAWIDRSRAHEMNPRFGLSSAGVAVAETPVIKVGDSHQKTKVISTKSKSDRLSRVPASSADISDGVRTDHGTAGRVLPRANLHRRSTSELGQPNIRDVVDLGF